ncbi:MAG TPA: excinuclease ABC subunit UvrC [Myxococcota bacterium]
MTADSASERALVERIDALPQAPGVYLLKSARGKVLYVGKAQNLRSRVRQYFAGGDGRMQLPNLMARTADVSVLVTESVKNALLLENELIKQHRPPFNVRLRDDKQYLALRLDRREEWPRLTQVRRFAKDGADYFGPYTSSVNLRASLNHLRRLFPLRSCSEGVFRDYARRGRPCIEHEMKRCPAPCVGRVTPEAYRELLAGTELFLRGRSAELTALLRTRMAGAAEAEDFEEAARLRDRIAAVEDTVTRQQIVSERAQDRDVFGLARRAGEVEIQVLHVREGRVTGASEHSFSNVEIPDEDVMASFLAQFYADEASGAAPAEVLVSVAPSDDGALAAWLAERAGRAVEVRVPQRGAPRELGDLALKNAEGTLERRIAARETMDSALADLQEKLGLANLPQRIECYDVSNLAGTLAVASRVVFESGAPDKNAYRRYRIHEAQAGDDLACMREVLTRRLDKREKEPLPDLWVLDGGRGQLKVATTLLRDRGLAQDHVGLAKERDDESPSPRVKRGGGLKAERVFLPDRVNPVLLLPSSRGLLLLQRIRDEAHRFAIEFQRSLRRRVGMRSVLEEIPGIGPGKRRALLRELGSLKRVREASVAELAAVSGVALPDAERIHAFFRALASDAGVAEFPGVEGGPPTAEAPGGAQPGAES